MSIIVTLADPAVTVSGWPSELDYVGEYTLRTRKTPEELREERRMRKDRYGDSAYKVNPMSYTPCSCISKDPAHPDTVSFLPGLWPRVKAALDNRHDEYTVIDKRNPDIRPDLDMSAFEGVQFRAQQDIAIAKISLSDCGIIETTTGWGKSFLISLLCKAYPTLNIVVTTSSTQVVATLYEYLVGTLGTGVVGVLYGGKDTTAGKRVVVTTLKSLPNIPSENVHLLLVDEAHSIGHNQAGNDVMQFCFARRFGFTASPVRNDGSGLLMEAILGPTIMKMTYQESADAGMVTPMKYLMLPCAGCPPAAKRDTDNEVVLKRESYWRNNNRNNVIKKFVYDLKASYDGQILIMVGTLQHAIHLHMLLPWFKVAHYGAVDMDDIAARFPRSKYPDLDLSKYKMTQKQLDIMRAAFAKGTLRYVISTKVFRQGVNFTHLSCLVRADGDVSSIEGIQIPGRLSRLDDGKDFAYLVDVMDTFSPWAHSRAKAREALYKGQQWQRVEYQELINDISKQAKGHG